MKCQYMLMIQNGFVSKVGLPEIPRQPGNDSYMIHFRRETIGFRIPHFETKPNRLSPRYFFVLQAGRKNIKNSTKPSLEVPNFPGPKFWRSQVLSCNSLSSNVQGVRWSLPLYFPAKKKMCPNVLSYTHHFTVLDCWRPWNMAYHTFCIYAYLTTLPKTHIAFQKWWLGDWFAFWEGLLSGAMFVLGECR